jgi:hypothetical protein
VDPVIVALPEHPASRPLAITDKPLFDRLFAQMQPELSQYTFTNLFAGHRVRATVVSRLNDCVLVQVRRPDRTTFLEPLGDNPSREIIEQCAENVETVRKVDSRQQTADRGERIHHQDTKAPRTRNQEPGTEFAYLSWNTVVQFQADPRYLIQTDRDNSDYLYLASDLIDLPGGKYDAKRDFIRRFKAACAYRYLEFTPDLARRCREFEEHWCEDRSCQSDEGLNHERAAIIEMLGNYEALGYRGGALEVNDEIVAFALGERLNSDTLVVHVEKANAKLTGVYAVINNEFLRREATRREASGFKYVNRGQDLGIPGLRQAKLSYHPYRLTETWRLTRT